MKRWLWILPLAGLACFALFIGAQRLLGNFHEVIPNELYRSAQLSPQHLTTELNRYGIRTVLNLRGESAGQAWYEDERRVAQEHNVNYINYHMSSSRELSVSQAQELIAIMRNAPKPLLIHCRAGADRTGLASALYLASIANQGEWAAEMQLWPIYGHLPLHFNSSMAMDRTFDTMKPYLGFSGS